MSKLALREVPIGQIRPDPEQPRKTFDEDEDKAFVQSVKQHGILTPIRLRENGDGYVIVAGERRWRAAKAAKLTAIPAVIAKPENALVEATIENVMRQDLNPVEEGHAYRVIAGAHPEETVDGLDAGMVAKLVTRPVERVQDRLALTDLPQLAQEQIVAGLLPLTAARVLVDVNKVSTPLATAFAWGIQKGLYAGTALAANPSECLRYLTGDTYGPCPGCKGFGWTQPNGKAFKDEAAFDATDESGEAKECATCDGDGRVTVSHDDRPSFFLLASWAMIDAGDVAAIIEPLTADGPDERATALTEAWEAYAAKVEGSGQPDYQTPRPQIADGTTDAARSYGCLLEIGNRGGYLTDPAFAAEYVTAAIIEATKRVGKKQANSSAGSGGSGQTTMSDTEKAQRKTEREEAAKAQVEARKLNDDLYAKLAVECHKVKPTVETVQAIARLLVLTGEGWLGHRGLGLIDPQLQEVVPPKKLGGKVRITYAGRDETAVATFALIDKAKTVDQAWGALMQILLAAMYASEDATPKSDYRRDGLPSLTGWAVSYMANDDPKVKAANAAYTKAYAALGKVAKSVVPAKLRAAAKGAFS